MHNSFNEEFDEKYWEGIKYEVWLESIGGVEHLENFIKKDFIKIKEVYTLVENKGVEILDKEKFDKINDECNKIESYPNKLEIWKKYALNPFKKYEIELVFEGRKVKPFLMIYPNNIKEIELYLDYVSEWVYEKLLDIEDRDFEVYTKEQCDEIYNKKYDDVETIEEDIDRIFADAQYIINNGNWNPNFKMIDYIERRYIKGNSVRLSHFYTKKVIIEEIWSVAIWRGILYGHCKCLKYLRILKSKLKKGNNIKQLKRGYSFNSVYDEKELEGFYNKLKEYKYIDDKKTKCEDFVKVFNYVELKNVKPIICKERSGIWIKVFSLISLLTEVDISSYEDEKIFKDIFIRTFCFEGKEEGNEMKEHYEKSRKKPFDKVFKDKEISKDIQNLLF